MKLRTTILFLALNLVAAFSPVTTTAHDVIFCGERIPLSDRFISEKLMNIIKKQIGYINVPELRARINQHMGLVEYYLRATGLPEDFKYLAIVESGFKNEVSSAGAAGFWQLMKGTAQGYGLIVNDLVDERTDINKATYAACKVIAEYYLTIRKQFGISSWVLTAAAYNNGIGNIKKAITRQGKDYFRMQLNKETAEYVYKIIAVKELFEYPEIYMKNFGYNIFSSNGPGTNAQPVKGKIKAGKEFGSVTVNVNQNDGSHPLTPEKNGNYLNKARSPLDENIKFVSAKVDGNYRKFLDGDIINFTLVDDLQVGNRFYGKGNTIQGKGWIIDGRVLVDLGYERKVTLYDTNNQKGILPASLKNNEKVILKVSNS